MKRISAFSSATIAVVVLTLGLPFSATAQESDVSLDDAVAAALHAELNSLARESGGVVSFDNVIVDVSAAAIEGAGSTDPEAIADYLVEAAELESEFSSSMLAPRNDSGALFSRPIASAMAARTTQFYTADQTTVLPSFGIAWVNQDMNVTFTGNTINSVSLRGNSYGTGISLFAYTHINTSLEYRLNRTCLYTRMRGTFSAIVRGSFLSFAATVLATDAPRGGRMVSLSYWQC